ncbi:MAG: EAL domain-containing protein, partial [Bacilli bacterium]|nr:EAL domain-containing protein [Bacilli bacterium]
MDHKATALNGDNKFFRFLRWLGELLGFTKNSPYVKNYIADSNIRSGIFMGGTVVILEIWLIIRQTFKYIIPEWEQWGSSGIMLYTSTFILFLLVGLSIATFSIVYESKRIKRKTRLALYLATAGATVLYCIYVFFENYKEYDSLRNIISNTTLIITYVAAFATGSAILVYAIVDYLKPKKRMWLCNVIFILFAVMCFAFGMKVSYGDYTSSKQKQIMCFLTMVMYGSGMIIWKPWISIVVNVTLFYGFYGLIVAAGEVPGTTFNDGDFINYTTFLIGFTTVCIMVYHQRYKGARNSEVLEYNATHDTLTGVMDYVTFAHTVSDNLAADPDLADTHVLLFTNIQSFKSYNDRRSFSMGNEFLRAIAREAKSIFEGDLVCRQSDDHFIIYTERDTAVAKMEALSRKVIELDGELALRIKFGVYALKSGEDPFAASDKARYACSQLRTDHTKIYMEYDIGMERGYELVQYIIHNLERAMEEGHIKPFYQPVVWSEDQTLCGAEALCRWISPEYGFISPGVFVPVLESTKLCYKLDAHILRTVCRDLRARMDKGLPVVPVSVNFSRRDFSAMDVTKLLDETLGEFRIDKSLIHVEVTESALTDSEARLSFALGQLKKKGYSLWLDDFGSGYSSLNVLKDY